MNDKEYTYDIDKYTIGVDENGEDGIGLTVAKIENGGIKFLGNCYGENARCIDLLIKENQEVKKQVEEYKERVNKGLYNTCLPYKTGYDKAIKDKKTQQKEFVKYLEDEIKLQEKINDKLLATAFEEILQKYKETIGDDK